MCLSMFLRTLAEPCARRRGGGSSRRRACGRAGRGGRTARGIRRISWRFQGPDDGGDDLAEVGDDAGVDGVGLGQLAHALGEVADLAGVDDDGGQPVGQQGADGGLLVRAGRFEDDALGGEGPDPGDEFGDAGGGVGEAAAGRGGADVGVEVVFADIDADEECAHDGTPEEVSNEASAKPTAFLFELVNAGCPSDYSNQDRRFRGPNLRPDLKVPARDGLILKTVPSRKTSFQWTKSGP